MTSLPPFYLRRQGPSRRATLRALFLAIFSLGSAVRLLAGTEEVVTAANAFLNDSSLTTAQKTPIDSSSSANLNKSVLYNGTLANAEVWSNIPVSTSFSGATRNGLIFTNLTTAQRTSALAVASAALSTTGKKLLDDVRAADRYISGEVTNAKGSTSGAWGYNKYFIAYVGAPSTSAPWTFQFGGHHLAYNITYNGTYTSGTPLFAGTEPNSWTDSTGTYAPLGTQRSLLEQLRPTLTTAAVLSGTFSDVVFGPNGSGPGATSAHDTTQPKSYPTSGRGQLYSALTSDQQALVRSYIESWVNTQAANISTELLAIYESPAALAETYVGYAGSSTTLRASSNYFRVDGPRVWIEFSVQGGVYDQSGYHDHGVWRDKLADYGAAYGTTTIATTVRPPSITTQPASQTTGSGSSVTFSVVAASAGSGTSTLSYQWYQDGAAIAGATAASYTTTASTSTAGVYYVQVISTGGLTQSSSATLTIGNTAPAITTASPLASGIPGSSYSQTLAATGGTAPYTWTLSSGTLPPGLSLAASGVIGGTPTGEGTFAFSLTVTDSANQTDTASFSITTAYPALVLSTTSPLAGGAIDHAYSITFAATGGTSSGYTWALSSGTLPDGLLLSSAGVLSGTPTASGNFSFGVTVTDSASHTATGTFALSISGSSLALSTSSPLPAGILGQEYAVTFTATGGTAGYSWSKTAGSLPSGLSLSTDGVLSGTNTAAGTFTFTVQVTDAANSSVSQAFSLTVTKTDLLIGTAAALPGAGVRTAYTQTLVATGGSGTGYSWSKTSGALPAGLSLSTAGVISGTPSASGSFSFTVQVQDSLGDKASQTFTLTVAALSTGNVGTFTGLINRESSVNSNLGGRFTFTTTSKGAFTGKLILGAVSKTIKGQLAGTASGDATLTAAATWPTLGKLTLNLALDSSANTALGTLASTSGSTIATGWRKTWSAAHPPTSRLGYYSAALDLADSSDEGQASIPQGVGFIRFTIPKSGVVVVTGRTSDGVAFSNSTNLGPQGELLVYQSLQSGKGSLSGIQTVASGATVPENSVTGSLTWLRAAGSSRLYAAGFGPINLSVGGHYLASSSTGQVVLGLPTLGATASLAFTAGGLENAATNPDVIFTYTDGYKVVLPTAGGVGNPAKVKLTINKANGALAGTFQLTDSGTSRTATFAGSIVRLDSATTKGIGYFLLPAIPTTGQSASKTAILSGQVIITQ